MVSPRACGTRGPEQAGRSFQADALGEQVLEVLHERRQRQEEREDKERQEHRREDFPDDVAVERLGASDSR